MKLSNKKTQKKLSTQSNEICKHTNTIKKYCNDTGDKKYDPGSDINWIEYTCLECGKNWKSQK